MKYRVVLEPQPEGGYTAYVPALPGCVSQGETTHEALANIEEAIEGYLESLRERRVPLPGEKDGDGAAVLRGEDYPSLVRVWDNGDDAVFDAL
ncbi:MAG: type II toxin-antitoxin system HicB family antitoxin [Chloroflexi bacterium]|nr:type II toxin-antitoxin system HicB family antitoxin [Chloroflexota bacterium]